MSASLVGSEMCIRDSPFEPHGCFASEELAPNPEAHQKGQSVQKRVGFGAVSYTHLTLPTICSV
eukprot:7285736-Alexandrium_andersonii.AAC.1